MDERDLSTEAKKKKGGVELRARIYPAVVAFLVGLCVLGEFWGSWGDFLAVGGGSFFLFLFSFFFFFFFFFLFPDCRPDAFISLPQLHSHPT